MFLSVFNTQTRFEKHINLEWKKEGTSYSAVFEDDGKVAYGYLEYEDEIVGDVWIYNRFPAPIKPEWTSPENMPFANAKEYVSDDHFIAVENESEVTIAWEEDETSPATLLISIRNQIIAKIKHGSRPGWCKLAAKDGPLAKSFNQ